MFIPDTNILIDFGKVRTVQEKLESAVHKEQFAIAPPVLTELIRGMIASGEKTFASALSDLARSGQRKAAEALSKQFGTLLGAAPLSKLPMGFRPGLPLFRASGRTLDSLCLSGRGSQIFLLG